MSIGTQKTMLKEYAKRNGFLNCQFYVDDGYSGTNYDRPAFQQLIEDIRNGEISTLITKDLSRLGRNYLETGTYIEVFFPNHNVRYIAVNDGVDSIDNTQMDITPFRNIINEMYAKDTSRKIKSALRTRKLQGKYMATTPPFGYRKDESDHNHLVIDEVTAPVVELIFSIAEEGVGLHTICNRLRKSKVMKPSFYKKELFERYIDEEKMYDWDTAYISKILHDPVYAGNLIVAERPTKTMRSKKRQYIPFAEREVIYGTHDTGQGSLESRPEKGSGKKQLWLCRPAGTWCLRERDTFIKGSREHNTFCFYAEQTSDKILAYAVELTGIEKGRVTGNLYELDYQKHYEHVKDASVPAGDTKLIYENGERMQEAEKRITGDADPDLGKFLRFEEQPKDPAALRGVLWDEKYSRDHFDSGDIKAHIEKLSGKEKKPSLRAQLAQDKGTVKAAPKKQAAMTAAMPYMETEIQELAERTAEKLKKLTEEEFAGLVFLPAEDME